MFDRIRDLNGLMQQAGQMREHYERLHEKLGERTVEGEAGAGAVRVTMNGRFETVRVDLDRPMITTLAGEGSDADADMVQELIASAVNAAREKAQGLMQEELRSLAEQMNVPGLEQLLQPGGGLGGATGHHEGNR